MLSKARDGADDPSTRIHNPAQPVTSLVFTYEVNRSLFPRYLVASNICMRVPNPLGFVATQSRRAAFAPVWPVVTTLTVYSFGLSPASIHPAGKVWPAESMEARQKASVGAKTALIEFPFKMVGVFRRLVRTSECNLTKAAKRPNLRPNAERSYER